MSKVTNARNRYCQALGIEVPSLEQARERPDANYYGLLLVALLERGEPITLREAAERFEEAGIAPADEALASLKRCKPGRAPIYRDGDLYALDPYDAESDLWAFRLGLRPPATQLRVVRDEPAPLSNADAPLTIAQLDEAWVDGLPVSISAQRVAICVLDAHGAAMSPKDVLSFVSTRAKWSPLSLESAAHWRKGAPVRAREDGLWELDPTHVAVGSAREAIRARIQTARRWAHVRPDPAVVNANIKRVERKRRRHGETLARLRRAIVYAFPARKPEALVVIDLAEHTIDSFVGDEIADATSRLVDYDLIAAIDVRRLLHSLGFEPGERRLSELGPPQKTRRLNKRGRKLNITARLLVQGSCGIARPFGDEEKLRAYLQGGQIGKLRRRVEADAKSLHALYQYGRTHGMVRLRWGFLDESLLVPWVHRDEPVLWNLKEEALERDVSLEVVVGSAPGWARPWSRARRVRVEQDPDGWHSWLVDHEGRVVEEADVQLARLAGADRGSSHH